MSSELHNIIVVGASAAGHVVVNNLASTLPATHRIILVERSEFVIHAPTVVRALVVPGWEDKNLTARITQDTIFPADSRHRVLCPNSVIELRESSVVLEHAFEGETEISFDKCILATGAQQPAPMRPVTGSSLDDYRTLLRGMQADIKAASSVLVVGGGTVGVEVAGEINATYPDKKVTIVHMNTSGLLNPGPREKPTADPKNYVPYPTAPKLSTNLEKQLSGRGVNVILGARGEGELSMGPRPLSPIALSNGDSVEADYVFLSTGNIPNSGLVRDADPKALTPSGHIAVDSLFRVIPSSPTSPMSGEYYALGDVASVPAWKTLVNAQAEGPALAKIIDAEVKGKTPSSYTPAAGNNSVVVTLGDKGGGGILVLPFLGEVGAPGLVVGMKNKDFFAGRAFYSRFQGATNVTAT